MDVARSINNVPIRLNDERWRHIVTGHPELVRQGDGLLRAVADPDYVFAGLAGELLAARRVGELWLVVAYREVSEQDGFVITAYLTRRDPSLRRMVVWTRQS
jgi:hypothetical protein